MDTASEDAPSITRQGLANEDADVPSMDVIEDIAPCQFSMWVLATLRDSSFEGASPQLVDTGGPWHSF